MTYTVLMVLPPVSDTPYLMPLAAPARSGAPDGSGTLPLLQTGQILAAHVVESRSDGTVTLRLLDTLLDVRTPLQLAPGQSLKLAVEQDQGRILLRLLEPTPSTETLSRAWRTHLPQQRPLGEVLNTLAHLIRHPEAPAGHRPPPNPLAGADAPNGTVPPATGGSGITATTRAAMPSPVLPAAAPTPNIPASTAQAVAPPGALSNAQPLAAPLPLHPGNPIAGLIRQLFAHLPSVRELGSADGLREALRHSGLFLENHLARHQSPGTVTTQDLQGTLLRLAEAIRTELADPRSATPTPRDGTPPPAAPEQPLRDLLQQVEGGLSRLKTQQLQTFASQEAPDPAWAFELPLRQGERLDVLQLRIARETAHDPSAPPRWSVRLHFDHPSHGAVDALVTLLERRVSVFFWSQQATTATLFRERLEELQGILREAGLEVGQLGSSNGMPPPAAPGGPAGLLDVNA